MTATSSTRGEATAERSRLLACATVAVPAFVVVPFGHVDAGFQSAVKLGALAVVACIFTIAAHSCRDRTGRDRMLTREEALLAAFAALAVLSAIAASTAADGAAVLGCAVCLFLVARGARVCLRGQWSILEDACLWAAAGTAGIAMWELVGVHLPWGELRRPVSTLGNRNQLAGYLILVLPVLLGAVVRRRRFAMPVALVAVIIVVVTHCRSAYLCAAAAGTSALVAALLHRRRGSSSIDRRRVGAVLGILAVGIVVGAMPWPGLRFGPSVVDSASRVFEYDSGSGHARLLQHELGFAALGHDFAAWSMGFGAGAWERVTAGHAHCVGEHAPKVSRGALPNSDLLRILVEQGLVGLALLTGVAVLLARRALATRSDDVVPGVVMLASLVAAGVLAVFDPQLVRPERIAVLGMLLGVGALPPSRKSPRHRGAWQRIPIAVAAVTCALALLRVASYAASSSIGTDTGRDGLQRWQRRQVLAQRLFPRSSLDERRALAFALQDRCDAADDALQRFIATHPHHWGARVEVAQCFARLGRAREARRIWNDALAVEPHVRELLVGGRVSENSP